MKRILVIVLLVISSYAEATVSLQPELTTVHKKQVFRVVLTNDGNASSELPDLTPLQQDFTIVGTEQSTNYTIVNGQASSTSQWTVLLLPKRTGQLTIPAIRVGQETTQASNIEVTEDDNATVNPHSVDTSKDVMMHATVSNEHPYINEQVIYTVKLYNSKRLVDASFQQPVVDDALLVPLGDSRRYQTRDNGRIYLVEEQQYAIFPQKSGAITITAPTFSALVYNGEPEQMNVTADNTVLKVKPMPADFKGRDWFPAKQVTLSEEYDRSSASLTEGSTLVRTVTLKATGLPAQLLPALSIASSGDFNIYPDKPVESNELQHHDLVGTKTVKVTYLLNQPGKVLIPAQQIAWFNTVTGREETASLPELSINVLASNSAAAPVDKSTTLPLKQVEPSASSPNPTPAPVEHSSIAWFLAYGFALAWLITLFFVWQGPRLLSKRLGNRQVLKAVREACLANNPELAKVAMLRWASWQWPDATVLNLAEINQIINDSVLKKQLDELIKALYQPNQQAWRGDDLWRCVAAYKETPSAKNKKKKPLPPLNP